MNLSNCVAYVITSPNTYKQRFERFTEFWERAKNYYKEQTGKDCPPLNTITGMNSERFERSPFWRVGSERTDKPDKYSGNGLDRRGHTACYWAHLTAWQTALALQDENFETGAALFLEDDALLDDNAFTGQSEAEVDYALGSLTESGFLNGYALRNWVSWQGAGYSFTQGRTEPARRWNLQ